MVGRGRRKTGMKLIEEKTARDVCFCKRRAGLFKKAKELSVLCGAKVGVLVFSRSGKPITFDAPTLQTLIARQLGDDITSVETESPPPPPPAGADKGEALFQGSLAEKTSPFWWERADVGSMTLDELKTFASSLSVGIEERLKQLKDGGHAFDAQEKMMDANVFPCQEEPSSIHDGSSEVPLMADIIVGEQSNDDQMKSHQPLLGGEYGWNAAAAAGQMMDESFFIPNSWPPSGNIEEQMLMEDSFFIPNLYSPAGNIEEQMLMDENFFIPNLCSPAAIEEQMLMDEHFFIPSLWPSSTDIGGGQQMPISFEDEPSSTDGRQLAAPNLLPCKPSVDATKKNTSFQPLNWSDLFMQHQWI